MNIVYVNGNEVEFNEDERAYHIIKKLNLKDIIVCKIDNVLSDLNTPLKAGNKIEFLTFEDDEGKKVFWHSSAHILGYALMELYPDAKLSNGPPIEEGFYYDFLIDKKISEDDYSAIEKKALEIIKRAENFSKAVESKEQLLERYKNNKYKTYYIEKGVEKESSIYTVGSFVDFCLGPHISNSKLIKAFKIINHGGSYFLGDSENDSLQRIRAISFPNKKQMKEYLTFKEEAKKRDHRKLGVAQNMFFFNDLAPGSCFFLPDGAHIYNKLMEFLRTEYLKRGYEEVITPNLYSTKLWEISGHLQNYKENMFVLNVDGQESALKPMNCPGHCVMFSHTDRSYRELPWRIADFGVLHRNELSGTLSGLTRVRRFQQDDAHIFCRRDQIFDEVKGCLDFVETVYSVFNFTFELLLSTRPEKFLGEIEEWDDAEENLKKAITASGHNYKINEGDGAFYGPKIDIILKDALHRKIQCATVQLDFQLPQRFGLKYRDEEGKHATPVMVHRAILGSLERMMAIIIESYGKVLPFWLSPRQIIIISIGVNDYAEEIKQELPSYKIKILDDNSSVNKKVLKASNMGYNIIMVIGNKEKENKTVTIRNLKNTTMSLEEFKDLCGKMNEMKKELEYFFE
ncbi:Threonyl-tRNA synthetase [Spraguea lophii 42_110]|uniref:Probable threonine--tRNA ligase, cytoplasmic n=1 Tax=Spraguea lophii (strain 42_110) TaxID=1358809 RepID=S7W964_SPRLO|nr:Threonyl-tRNA synthetase [Spraguea lophii 42_110]